MAKKEEINAIVEQVVHEKKMVNDNDDNVCET